MDNYGLIRGNWTINSEPKDDCGRLWTIGSALQNRRLQVRFLSHLPPETLNLSRLQRHGVQLILRALTLLDPNGSMVRCASDPNNLRTIISNQASSPVIP